MAHPAGSQMEKKTRLDRVIMKVKVYYLCFRFVGYETVREAEAAIQKFDGFDLGQGYRLKVALALSKQKPTFGDLEEKMSDGTSNRVQDDGAASR